NEEEWTRRFGAEDPNRLVIGMGVTEGGSKRPYLAFLLRAPAIGDGEYAISLGAMQLMDIAAVASNPSLEDVVHPLTPTADADTLCQVVFENYRQLGGSGVPDVGLFLTRRARR